MKLQMFSNKWETPVKVSHEKVLSFVLIYRKNCFTYSCLQILFSESYQCIKVHPTLVTYILTAKLDRKNMSKVPPDAPHTSPLLYGPWRWLPTNKEKKEEKQLLFFEAYVVHISRPRGSITQMYIQKGKNIVYLIRVGPIFLPTL